MDNLKFQEAYLISGEGDKIKIINPNIKNKRGLIIIDGILDMSIPDTKEKIENFEQAIGWREKKDNVFKIIGMVKFDSIIEIDNVHCIRLHYNNLKLRFISHGYVFHKYNFNYGKSNMVDSCSILHSINIEGLEIAYDRTSTYDKKRVILNKEEVQLLSSKFDYTEKKLHFSLDGSLIELNITFQNSENNNTFLRIENTQIINLLTYKKVKKQLRAFLSYPTGNTLNFKEEYFFENGVECSKIYSFKEVVNVLNRLKSWTSLGA